MIALLRPLARRLREQIKLRLGLDEVRHTVAARRRRIAERLFEECGGVVRHGPLKGLRLAGGNWSIYDKAAMLLGLYEQELLALLDRPYPGRPLLVNLGAADGYYPIGLLRANRFERALCFELSETGRATIAANAETNGVAGRITLRGAAGPDLLAQLRAEAVDPAGAVVLCDIEGAEFDLLTDPVLGFLAPAVVLIETHAHLRSDGPAALARLIAEAGRHFRVTEFRTGARDPSRFPELESWSDNDRWLLCSEGRASLGHWLLLEPREAAA